MSIRLSLIDDIDYFFLYNALKTTDSKNRNQCLPTLAHGYKSKPLSIKSKVVFCNHSLNGNVHSSQNLNNKWKSILQVLLTCIHITIRIVILNPVFFFDQLLNDTIQSRPSSFDISVSSLLKYFKNRIAIA